jgi:transcription elongation factor Elf1
MPYITRKVQENALKCETCRFNFINDFKKNDAAKGAMKVACKLCPNRKDFEKIYGVEPVTYYSSLFS